MHDATTHPDPRTGLTVLSDDECWARLRTHAVGRVAVTVGTTPDIFPVNYCLDGGEIVIRTEAGTKLAAGTMMPAVAFEVDELDAERRRGWSVVVKGHGREPVGVEEVLRLEELELEPWADAPKSRWLIITPTEVTGRSVDGT